MKHFFLLNALLLSACASTYKGKQVQTALIGAAVGAGYGASIENNKGANTALYGSVGALAALGASLFIFDADEALKEILRENGLRSTEFNYRTLPIRNP